MVRRARVFVDHGAFCEAWSRLNTGAEKFNQSLCNPAWDGLFASSIDALQRIPLASSWDIECDTAYVYAYLHPNDILEQADSYKALHFDLDCRSGFSVRIIEKQRKEMKCDKCPGKKGWVWEDKGLDTRISVDLLSAALDDHFDVAVLFSDSDELVPAVETVQSVFNRKVVHVGDMDTARHLRAAAWAHAPLDLSFCRAMSTDPARSSDIASLVEVPRSA